MATAMETRLQSRADRREIVQSKHDDLYRELDGGNLSDTDKKQVDAYREELAELDQEIESLTADVEANRVAVDRSKALRRASISSTDGVDLDGDGIVYRDFASYARDELLARSANSTGELAKFANAWGGDTAVESARERLQLVKRTPANTLSSDVAGLQPSQHIAQIFQVINNSRPIVASSQRTTLDRLTLTYPVVATKPVVAVQSTEKTEAGNTKMSITMATTTASTYLGGGDISWQAAQFSTPNAIDLWFRFVTSDYALKTEQDAAQVLQHSAFSYNIATTLAASSTFAAWMTAIGAGYSDVFTNSGRTANTLYLAPDLFGYLLGLTSSAFTQFMSVSANNMGPLNIVVSRGMDAGVAVVGDSEGILVAENEGAPVELRVVEPAIGGFEVGLIGAFEAVIVDPGAFAMITTAS